MENFTVFTPTYNREKTLIRVYESLLNQTYKKFVWLIIDDGSYDNTKELVQTWINEKKINIEYHYQKNMGKHAATRLGWQLIKTKYIVGVDSDDELIPEALEIYKNEWDKIVEEGNENEFAEIRALTKLPDGTLNGNFYFPKEINHIDSTWHEMVLKNKNNNENSSCRNVEKLKECVEIPEKFWLSDKINFFAEYVLWARLGKRYKTRYINQFVYIVHYDGGESLLRIEDKTRGHYNNLVGNKYFIDENIDYFCWNPKYFVNLTLKFIISGIELKFSPTSLLKEMNSPKFKILYFLLFPAGFLLWGYYKYIKKAFWF